MRKVSVAVVQMAPRLGEVEENLRQMREWIERVCLEQRVDLIVFPELATSGHECGVRFTDLAEKVPGHVVNYLARQAAEFGVHLAFGMALKERVESIIYNAAILLGPEGEVIGDYRKVHLKGEERMAFRPGYRFPVLETGLGGVGLLIGWDLAFPEAARCLTLEGAELLCVLANWEYPHLEEWRTYVLARAYENSLFVAAANRIGQEPSYSFFGASMVVGPRGKVYASLNDEEGYLVAQIDLDEVRKYREEFQVLQWREPQSYRAIVRRY